MWQSRIWHLSPRGVARDRDTCHSIRKITDTLKNIIVYLLCSCLVCLILIPWVCYTCGFNISITIYQSYYVG